MKRWMLALGIAFGLVLVFTITGPAWAKPAATPTPSTPTPTPTPPPQSGGPKPTGEEGIEMGEALGRMFQQVAISAGVGAAYVITNLAWFMTRFLLSIYQIVLAGEWSTQLVDTTLQQLQVTMPQILQSIMLGQNGLLYLALAVAGITMVFPFLMRGSPVRIDRVFIWGALILGLFAGSEATGYNIISLFEHTRVAILTSILGFGGQDVPSALQNLVLEPWRATQTEAQLDLNFRLPRAFQQAFFPEPQTEDVVVNLARAWWQSYWTLETPQSLERRRDSALRGLFWAAIGIYGVIVLGFVAFASVALALTSLLLIVLFLSTLPLALFSFGEALVLRVVQRWVGVVAATLFLGVFLLLTSGWVQTLSLAGGEIAVVVTWFAWMTFMLIAFAKLAHLALDLFTSSLLLVGTVAGVVMGGMSQFREVRGTASRVVMGIGGLAGGLALVAAHPQMAVMVTKYALPIASMSMLRQPSPPRAFRGRENVFMARAEE